MFLYTNVFLMYNYNDVLFISFTFIQFVLSQKDPDDVILVDESTRLQK